MIDGKLHNELQNISSHISKITQEEINFLQDYVNWKNAPMMAHYSIKPKVEKQTVDENDCEHEWLLNFMRKRTRCANCGAFKR